VEACLPVGRDKGGERREERGEERRLTVNS